MDLSNVVPNKAYVSITVIEGNRSEIIDSFTKRGYSLQHDTIPTADKQLNDVMGILLTFTKDNESEAFSLHPILDSEIRDTLLKEIDNYYLEVVAGMMDEMGNIRYMTATYFKEAGSDRATNNERFAGSTVNDQEGVFNMHTAYARVMKDLQNALRLRLVI